MKGSAEIWNGVFLNEKQDFKALINDSEVIESKITQRYRSTQILVWTSMFEVEFM